MLETKTKQKLYSIQQPMILRSLENIFQLKTTLEFRLAGIFLSETQIPLRDTGLEIILVLLNIKTAVENGEV